MMLAAARVSVEIGCCTVLLQQLFLALQPPIYPDIIHALSEIIPPPYQAIDGNSWHQRRAVACNSLQ